jgi:4-hydroxy-3-methylbut-2-enyl diphosphate reductase IspH
VAILAQLFDEGQRRAEVLQSSRAFLQLFAEVHRSHIANVFLTTVRAGASMPESVVHAVRESALARLHFARRWQSRRDEEKFLI